MSALFIQNPLVLRGGDAAALSDTDVDATLEANGRGIRGPNGDDGHRLASQDGLGHRERRGGDDVAVGFDVRELTKKLVGHGKPRRAAVVSGADEDDSR